ncbi:hypothetical protein [Bauldia sp.]|uniref:hypothetical protein n=1 Tax=Bauldia sp. TaxID=2575872 RepID=UPI003BABDB43
MPTQSSNRFVLDSPAIEFSKIGQKWKIDDQVDVGSNVNTIVSERKESTLVNKGYIYSYTSSAVLFTKNDATLKNKEFGQINGFQYGVQFHPSDVTHVKGSLINDGDIYGLSQGVRNTAMGDFSAENYGEIVGGSVGLYSTALLAGSTAGPVIKNYKSIESEQIGVYVGALAGLRTKIVNQEDGVIKGGLTTSQADGAAIFTNAKVKLTNKGAIEGVVSLDNSRNDKVINEGKIKGDVYLGDGNDTFDNRDGKTKGYIFAQEGKDKLIAGDKKEKFVFDNLPDSDRVKNFESGKDKFFLDPAEFNGLSLGPLEKSAFRRGTEAKDADDRIIYDKDTGKLYIDSNGNAGGGQVQFAKVDPGQKLKYSDFTVELLAV